MTKKTKYFADLQVHSLYSDGAFRPAELAQILKKQHIKVAALADHNTLLSWPEFSSACRHLGIKAIPCTEIYVSYKARHLHLLAYAIDPHNPALLDELTKIHNRKLAILRRIAPLLARRGITIQPEVLAGEKAQYIGFNSLIRHLESQPRNLARIRRDLGQRNYEHWEVYNKYFRKGLKTHYPEVYIPIERALKIIQAAGGQAVLSHPGQQLSFEEDRIILELKKKGLRGVECFSSHHSYSQIVHYLRLARQHSLLATGGSDFHDILPENDLPIKSILDYYRLPYAIYQNIKTF